jgi:hypothetical protein
VRLKNWISAHTAANRFIPRLDALGSKVSRKEEKKQFSRLLSDFGVLRKRNH